ncbi:MAG: hypothetical protein ABII96_07900 [Candidatus Zixiibacteriota bacterium]
MPSETAKKLTELIKEVDKTLQDGKKLFEKLQSLSVTIKAILPKGEAQDDSQDTSKER